MEKKKPRILPKPAKKIEPLTKEEHVQLYNKMDWEGGLLGGYSDYGIDYQAVERLGFDIEKVKYAVNLLEEVETKIYSAAEFDIEDESDEESELDEQ